MTYEAKIVLDSLAPHGIRLTTFELTYPLIVHNEFLTHRAIGRSDEQQYDQWLEFSRNASSNRAIPSAKLIQQVLDDPYIPLRWARSTNGMIAGEDFTDEEDIEFLLNEWLGARDDAVTRVQRLEAIRGDEKKKLHKQWRNR